jgi:hypothetical protein
LCEFCLLTIALEDSEVANARSEQAKKVLDAIEKKMRLLETGVDWLRLLLDIGIGATEVCLSSISF